MYQWFLQRDLRIISVEEHAHAKCGIYQLAHILINPLIFYCLYKVIEVVAGLVGAPGLNSPAMFSSSSCGALRCS